MIEMTLSPKRLAKGELYKHEFLESFENNLPRYIDKHQFYGYCHLNVIEDKNYAHCYIIKIENTTNYKIGISTNLKARLAQYNNHSPFNHVFIAIKSVSKKYDANNGLSKSWYTYAEVEYIESDLLELHKDKKIKGEWIKLETEYDEKRLIDELFRYYKSIR